MKKAFFKKQRRAEYAALLFFPLKTILLPYFLKTIAVVGLFSLCSCIIGTNKDFLIYPSREPKKDGETSFERNTSKESDPEKQLRCQEMGGRQCDSNSDCQEICLDIFSRSTDKSDCLELPLELVQKFQTLLELAKQRDDIRKIDPDVLECLLDIDEKPFSRKLSQLNRRNTEAFLTEVTINKKLGDVMESEDAEYLLLTKLYDNLSAQGDPLKRLSVSINGGSHIFELIMEEENQRAWDWVAEYIEKKCENSNFCHSEKKDQYTPIVFYCRLLLELDSGRLRAALESDVFEDNFSHDIESEQVCGSSGDQECDSRYADHFESFCHSYTNETSL